VPLPLLAVTAHHGGVSGTLVVAITALAVSSASLAWQIASTVVSFRFSGSRVAVELRVGAHNGSGGLLFPLDQRLAFEELVAQGYTEPVLGVVVRNRGRLPVSVTAWQLSFDNGMAYVDVTSALNRNKPVPYRLEVGDEVTWLCPLVPVEAAAHASRKTLGRSAGAVHGRVILGTGGKPVMSKQSLRFD
jgi:hypothetical protein